MKSALKRTTVCATATLLASGAVFAADRPIPPIDIGPASPHARPTRPGAPHLKSLDHAPPVIPTAEPAVASNANAGLATSSAFSATGASANGQTLSPPVTVSYNGSSAALQVTDTGTGKAIQATINNSANASSALYGSTNGAGAGLTGYNGGSKGPAGKFGVTNAASTQAGVFATTNGLGGAVLGTVTNASSNYPAIYGQNITGTSGGIGVQGDGSSFGVAGTSTDGYGLYGVSGTGYAVYGNSSSSAGVYGTSSTGYGVNGESANSTGIYGYSLNSNGIMAESYYDTALYAVADNGGHGIVAQSDTGIGVYSSSNSGYGIWGQSTNSFGVIGADGGSGVGVYGSSTSGLAGWFNGTVQANTYVTLSDRNAKTDIKRVDGKDLLARIDRLSISSWKFKSDQGREHIGPMAQDFHAAFALAGDDDKHINVTDLSGISLAAIQELSKEVREKDLQIAALTHQLQTLEASFAARLTALERRDAPVVQTASLVTGAR